MKSEIAGEKNNSFRIKMIIAVIIMLIMLVSGFGWLYYSKLRVVSMAYDIYKNDCHMSIEYHIDYNTEDNDEEEGIIKSLGKGSYGFISLDKSGKEIKGVCYDDVSKSEFFEFYKVNDDFYINIKSILKVIISRLDENKETKVYNAINEMDDCYLTVNQIKEFFDIRMNNVEIDWGAVVEQAMHFKKCDAPENTSTSVDTKIMDFYSIEMEDDNQEIVFGIPKGMIRKSNLFYVSVVKETMRLELYGTFKADDSIEINAPDTALNEEELKKLKKNFKLLKELIALIM